MEKERTLHVVIEKAEDNYSAYIEEVDGVVAVGSTIDEIKQNMLESIRIYKEVCEEDGFDVPEALKGDYEISFKMDMKSFLEFYSAIFSKPGLERISGINQKQLWHYASGKSKPRPEQAMKLESALHKLGAELVAITL